MAVRITQTPIRFIAEPFAGGEVRVINHGLNDGLGRNLEPNMVMPDRGTPIRVLAVTPTTITFENPETTEQQANFLAWFEFDDAENGIIWQGLSVTEAGGSLVLDVESGDDITVALSTAINDVTRVGGASGTIIIPQGDFLISSTIVINQKRGLNIIGQGSIATDLKWKGNLTSPMFIINRCQPFGAHSFSITAPSSNPCLEGFRIQQGVIDNTDPKNWPNLTSSRTYLGPDIVFRGQGFLGTAVRVFLYDFNNDDKNDHHRFEYLQPTGCTYAAFVLEGRNAKNLHVDQAQIVGEIGVGLQYCILTVANFCPLTMIADGSPGPIGDPAVNGGAPVYNHGASFHAFGGQYAGAETANVYIGDRNDALVLEAIYSEKSARWLVVPDYASGSSGAFPVECIGLRYSVNSNTPADLEIIQFYADGPLKLSSCRFGQRVPGEQIRIRYQPINESTFTMDACAVSNDGDGNVFVAQVPTNSDYPIINRGYRDGILNRLGPGIVVPDDGPSNWPFPTNAAQWASLLEGNVGPIPDSQWNLTTAVAATAWASLTAYVAQKAVTRGGEAYISVDGGTSSNSVSGLTVSVDAALGTFTRTAGSYLTEGFAVGQQVDWTGFTNAGNNVVRRTVSTLTATVMTFSVLTGLVNEAGTGNEAVDGGPTGQTDTIVDGTVTWNWVGTGTNAIADTIDSRPMLAIGTLEYGQAMAGLSDNLGVHLAEVAGEILSTNSTFFNDANDSIAYKADIEIAVVGAVRTLISLGNGSQTAGGGCVKLRAEATGVLSLLLDGVTVWTGTTVYEADGVTHRMMLLLDKDETSASPVPKIWAITDQEIASAVIGAAVITPNASAGFGGQGTVAPADCEITAPVAWRGTAKIKQILTPAWRLAMGFNSTDVASVITPAALGIGTTQNYDTTGLSEALAIRFTPNAGASALGGLVGGSDERELLIFNIGAANLTLNHADAGSTAANQFRCPGSANFVITPNGGIRIWYDITTTAWRVVSQ